MDRISHFGVTALTKRHMWNHLGFHRRIVWINVYATNKGVFYSMHDKKKLAAREPSRYPGWKLTHRLRVGPSSKFRPNEVWRKRKSNPPPYVEKPRKIAA